MLIESCANSDCVSEQVALSYLLAFAALGMLAFLAAPHPTTLAAHSGKSVHMGKATRIRGATQLAMRGRHGPLRSPDGHFANPFGRTEAPGVGHPVGAARQQHMHHRRAAQRHAMPKHVAKGTHSAPRSSNHHEHHPYGKGSKVVTYKNQWVGARGSLAPLRRSITKDVQRRQSLLYDSVTVGPYGSYDAQTYYFGTNGVQQEGDGTMYQPEIVYDALAPEGERLVPWRWNEVEYQDGPDMGNLAAPPPKNPLVPWTWDDVIYQTPEQA